MLATPTVPRVRSAWITTSWRMISANASVVMRKYSRRNRSAGAPIRNATSPVKSADSGQATHIDNPGVNLMPRSGSLAVRIT